VDIISLEYSRNPTIQRVIFEPGCQLRELDGFMDCPSLCRITVPASVKIIAFWALYNCTSLIEVTFLFNSQVKEILGFQECHSLRGIEIPASTEIIGYFAFHNCTSLTEVIFQTDSHIRTLRGFQECNSLCRIEIPASAEIIGEPAFNGCTSLKEVIFLCDSQIREIHGFKECNSLCRIEIPASTETIGERAFNGCTSLKEVIFLSESRIDPSDLFLIIAASVFAGCSSIQIVTFAENVQLRLQCGFTKCQSLCRMEIPASAWFVGGRMFYRKRSPLELVFRSGTRISKIGSSGFALRAFVTFNDDDDMKQRRRRLHLVDQADRIDSKDKQSQQPLRDTRLREPDHDFELL
jgi:hypothetical protein